MVLIGWCGCRSALCFFSVSVSVDNFDYPYCKKYLATDRPLHFFGASAKFGTQLRL